MSNFDKTFEDNKAEFKRKFAVDWNTNPSLYLQYLQTAYAATTAELINRGMINLSSDNSEIKSLLKTIATNTNLKR